MAMSCAPGKNCCSDCVSKPVATGNYAVVPGYPQAPGAVTIDKPLLSAAAVGVLSALVYSASQETRAKKKNSLWVGIGAAVLWRLV